MANEWSTKRVLITVRTYPTPAKKGIEVSCTAGITEDGQWIRLFPVPYRFLDADSRFKKYQWIDVSVKKASEDNRPESYKLNVDSINISSQVPTTRRWQYRKDLVFPLKRHCLCCIKQEQEEEGSPTLGVFKPGNIQRFSMEQTATEWTYEQSSLLRQQVMFQESPEHELEKIPYDFRYGFRCDESGCNGHSLLCTDWEMGQAYRSWRRQYGDNWEQKFRQKFETDMMSRYDTHFYVGTVHRYPRNWIIVGLFYPPL